jgi:phosphomannomutase/phosphoglucomutase
MAPRQRAKYLDQGRKISRETNLNRHIFREFSIRGIADQDLPNEIVVRIGQAIGTFFRQRDGQTLVVGQDVRNSSPRISRSLITGLVKTGLHVIDVGVVPTPIHNFATDFYAADGGVMVTASHNPAEYNGFKIRTDRSLRGSELREIYHIATEKYPQDSEAQPLDQSKLTQEIPVPHYLERVKTHARIPTSLRVVVDGGNGTNGLIVTQLLRDLGCDVVELFCKPDGDFPNRNPDPTAPGATSDLSALVRAKAADLGIAYDADGDRLVMVDEQGSPVWGDQMIMLLARAVLRHGPAKVVYEILCTQALADDVIAHGGEPVMTPNGYAFVHQAMHETGAPVGGEFSGHLFFNEPDFRFDDPILASVKLLNILSQSGRSLSTLMDELPAYFSSPQIRLPCPDEIKAKVVEQVKDYFAVSYPVDELDGARIDFGDGWALVRPSNTQPALSLRFEAKSEERLEQLKTQVLNLVEDRLSQLSQASETDPVST